MRVYSTKGACVCVRARVSTAISRTRLGRSSRRRAAGCGDGGVRALDRRSETEDARAAAAVWRICILYIYIYVIICI